MDDIQESKPLECINPIAELPLFSSKPISIAQNSKNKQMLTHNLVEDEKAEGLNKNDRADNFQVYL